MKLIKQCEICGNKQFELLFKQNDKNLNIPEKFSIFKCNKCGIIFLNPQPSFKELEKHYSSEKYYSLKKINTKESKKTRFKLKLYDIYFNRKNKNLLLKIAFYPIKFIIRGTKIEKDKNILDIGSGSGQFLYDMKELGMKVHGIEPGDFNEKEAKKYELNIEKKDLIKYKEKKAYFDIITMNHVLEHVNNPKEVIQKINFLLKSQGLFIIGVPNTNSLASAIFGKNWHQLDIPRHLFDYSNKNLRSLLEKNGFKILKIRYNSRPNQFVVSLYFALGIKKRTGIFNRILEGIFLPLTWLVNLTKTGDQIEIWCTKN
jgi:2-polyprenyl-3-methyl-5-hydroxy-6-metoxy-1,4-benzoquinol methylase